MPRPLGSRISPEHAAKLRAFASMPKSSKWHASVSKAWTEEKRERVRRRALEQWKNNQLMRSESQRKGRSERAARQLAKSPRFKNTAPELRVRRFLESIGARFEAQFVIDSAPFCVWDFAIPSKRILIEVDGCYWHGCRRCGFPPRFNVARNDARKNAVAKKIGWRLLRIKECRVAI